MEFIKSFPLFSITQILIREKACGKFLFDPFWEVEIQMRQSLRNLIEESSLDIYDNQLPIEVPQRDNTQMPIEEGHSQRVISEDL